MHAPDIARACYQIVQCYQDPDVAGRPSLASAYTGVETSLWIATAALAEHEPIDGFLGTSRI